MPEIKQILDCFPDHYYAGDPKKRLYYVAHVLTAKLSEDENNMTRILQSHWVKTLEEIIDLKRMAALYSDLGEPYDDGVNNGRERLRKIVRLYLQGPGTVPSIFEFSELELARYNLKYERNNNSEIVLRNESGYFLFQDIDDNKKHTFITRAKLERKTASQTSEEVEVFEVELEENPHLDFNFHQSQTLNRVPFFLNNNGFFTQYPKIIVTGIKQRTANFMIVNVKTGEAIGFRGRVNNASILTLGPGEKGILQAADLDGENVLEQVYSIYGAQFDKDEYNSKDAVFGNRRPKSTYGDTRFAGSEEDGAVFFQPPSKISIPGIPVGESEWHYQAVPARFDEAYFDQYVYHIPKLVTDKKNDVGRYDAHKYGQAVFAYDPLADIRLDWQTRERASFVLKLPAGAFNTEEQKNNLLEHTQKIINRVKAAGVKAEVKFHEIK